MGCFNSKLIFLQQPIDTIKYSSVLSYEKKSRVPGKFGEDCMIDVIWIAHDFITTESQNTKTSSSSKEQAVREQCTMLATDASKLSFWLAKITKLPETIENRNDIIAILRSYLDVTRSAAAGQEEGSIVISN